MKATRALWASLLFLTSCWAQAPPPAPTSTPTPSAPQSAPAPERKEQPAATPAKESPAAPVQTDAEDMTVSGVFHIVGIPGLKRNARGDLLLSKSDLTFRKGNKPLLVLPFLRIQKVELLSGERNYEKATAAAAAVSPVGAFLILAKHKVDTVVVEYVNERNGKMAMVLQLPEHEGARCQQWLARYGVKSEGQEPQPATPEKK